MKKEKIVKPIFLGLYLALYGLLVASAYVPFDEVFQSILMVAILTLSAVGVVYPLLKKTRITLWEGGFVALCFILLIAAIIVFASVSYGQYREPFIQISAALLGGGLTLYGVGLTIKSNRLDREQYEIEKAKPNVFPIGEKTWKQLADDKKIEYDVEVREDLSSLKRTKKTNENYSFAPILLANSDLSMCTFKGIVINRSLCLVFQYDKIILKASNSCFKVDYHFAYGGEIESVQLILGDMYGNTYFRDFFFGIGSRGPKKKVIVIAGARDFVKVAPSIENLFDQKSQTKVKDQKEKTTH